MTKQNRRKGRRNSTLTIEADSLRLLLHLAVVDGCDIGSQRKLWRPKAFSQAQMELAKRAMQGARRLAVKNGRDLKAKHRRAT
jgi:hypothetical protein